MLSLFNFEPFFSFYSFIPIMNLSLFFYWLILFSWGFNVSVIVKVGGFLLIAWIIELVIMGKGLRFRRGLLIGGTPFEPLLVRMAVFEWNYNANSKLFSERRNDQHILETCICRKSGLLCFLLFGLLFFSQNVVCCIWPILRVSGLGIIK